MKKKEETDSEKRLKEQVSKIKEKEEIGPKMEGNLSKKLQEFKGEKEAIQDFTTNPAGEEIDPDSLEQSEINKEIQDGADSVSEIVNQGKEVAKTKKKEEKEEIKKSETKDKFGPKMDENLSGKVQEHKGDKEDIEVTQTEKKEKKEVHNESIKEQKLNTTINKIETSFINKKGGMDNFIKKDSSINVKQHVLLTRIMDRAIYTEEYLKLRETKKNLSLELNQFDRKCCVKF